MAVALPEAPTVAELLDKLAALGSHKAIALYLTDRGITGTPCNAGICPIAQYLQAETGQPDINVGEEELVVWRGGTAWEERHTLPPPVRDFIAFFDARMHPDLIDPQRPTNVIACQVHPALISA